jgi:hypothetical protein
MLKRRIFASVLLILAVLLALSLMLPSTPAFANGSRPETSWSGNWQTSWTIMEYGKFNTYQFNMNLVQSGSSVTGTSNYYGWRLDGIVSGNTLIGTWSAPDLPPIPDPATGNYIAAPHIFGQVQLSINPAGTTFNGLFIGEYHYGLWDDRFVVYGEKTGSATQPITPSDTPSTTPSGQAKPGTAGTGCQFTGSWDTEWGTMTLAQNGNSLTGSYDYQGGKIQGIINGTTATGTWSEEPSYQPPYDAGDFIFTLLPDCKAIDGYWRYGSCEWEGDIRGTREDQPSPITPTGQWSGTWDSNWGDMTLTQSGNQVTGDYTHDTGRIVATVSGNTLRGTWSEYPSYAPPDDAGEFVFTLAADSQSFSGDWRYGSSGSWQMGGWTGTKTSGPEPDNQPPPSDWNGDWNTDWGKMQLSQAGNLLSGSYEYNDGQIEGMVSGNIATGTWSKAPTYSQPKDAGTFEFTLSGDYMSFIGNWKYSECGWSGDWDGILMEPDAHPQANHPPVASFYVNPQSPTTTDTVIASSTSTDPDGDALSYTWSLDGSIVSQYSNKPYLVKQNLSPGTHTILLVISDNKGGTASYQAQFMVSQGSQPQPVPGTNRPPIAAFAISPQSPTTADTIIASSTSSDPDGDPLFYTWSLNGLTAGEFNNLPYYVKQNLKPGNYTIGLIVSDGKGGTAHLQKDITVSQAPQPQPGPGPTPGANTRPQALFTIEPPQPSASEKIKVTSQSTDADGDKLSYTWYLDGKMLGQYTDQASWTWEKPEAGGHVLRLVVDDSRGGEDAISRKIKIIEGTKPDGGGFPSINITLPQCFIATTAYGSSTAAELDMLRAFRDRVLMQSEPGKAFVRFYYRHSPPVAAFIARHEAVRTFVREVMLDPIVFIVKHTQDIWDK